MPTTLTVGALVGAVLGFLHAWGVYSRRVQELPARTRQHPVSTRARAGYSAIWTWALWILFGSYVLYLWLISIPVWVAYRVIETLSYPKGQPAR